MTILPPPLRDAGPLETMARAMCAQHIREVRRWDTDPARVEEMLPAAIDYSWKDHEATAEAALTALTEAGYAIVPIEPTEAMQWAGWRAKDAIFSGYAEPMIAPNACYRAMISAAPPLNTKEGE